MGKVLVGFGVAFVFIVIVIVKYEIENPCLEYGPQRLLYMQQVGNVMVPIFGSECIKREEK